MIRLTPLKALFAAQFLSAFVDNMILFIVLAIIRRDAYPEYYLPFVQSTFLASYIVLSPWVGRFADRMPKSYVLIVGNIVKSGGVLSLFAGFNAAISYALVGIGAVIYSPAKYGILPFLSRNEDELLRSNSGLESYTILAILTGSIAGGVLSDISVSLALAACLVLYGLSIGINTFIPKNPGDRGIGYKNAISEFWSDILILFKNPPSHYSLIGTGSFWLASAVLRMIIFAWAPLVLGINSGTAISMIIAVTGVGIAIGAVITPYLVSIRNHLYTIWFGYALGGCIFLLLMISGIPAAIAVLLLIGIFGGIYIVPMNSCLQQIGHRTIGAGKTIAVQNFIENLFMFCGVGMYTIAEKYGVTPYISIEITGFLFFALLWYLTCYIKRRGRSNRL